ncbi:MAG: hypothetical protein KJZ78_16600 [Bryobacteraceae bacterium]|nr:hypothetical protein [Bryobacteraceae bacterium]
MKIVCSMVVIGLLVFVSAGLAQPEPSHETESEKAVEHAAAEEHDTGNITLWKIVNFALLAAGLGYLTKKFGLPLFQARTLSIQSGIAEASRLRQDAEARARELEQRMASLATEIDHMRENARQEISAEADRVRMETEQQLSKVQAHAEQEIEAAAKASRQELKAYSAELALRLAESRIRARLTPDTQDALVDSFIADLERPRMEAQ